MPATSKAPAYFLLALAYVLGRISLGVFSLFLSQGSAQQVTGPLSSDRMEPKRPKASTNSVDWKTLLPEVRDVLKKSFPDGQIEKHYAISIVKEADITGDGIPEALVYTGDGGASTDFLVLMRIEDGKPVLAQFKDAHGKICDPGFLQGASVMHGDSTVMLPDEKAIYLGEYAMNSTATVFSRCSASAYRWNARTKAFDWDRTLSRQTTRTFCEGEKKALFQQ
jgi:hypothetical protein